MNFASAISRVSILERSFVVTKNKAIVELTTSLQSHSFSFSLSSLEQRSLHHLDSLCCSKIGNYPSENEWLHNDGRWPKRRAEQGRKTFSLRSVRRHKRNETTGEDRNAFVLFLFSSRFSHIRPNSSAMQRRTKKQARNCFLNQQRWMMGCFTQLAGRRCW